MHHSELAIYRNLQGRLYRAAEIIDSFATSLRLFDAADPHVKRVDGTVYVSIEGQWQSLDNVHHVVTAAGQTLIKLVTMIENDPSPGELTY
ncbi:MAG: hypothetical protein OXS33_06215 [bacterium]|nr:hypothetical protein [bacterium]